MTRKRPRAATSGPGCGGPRPGLPRTSRRSFARTGLRPIAPPTSSSATPAAAEDIAQEAFLAAVRALDRFDRRRPFGPWLHRIVVNRAIDWARARALRPEAEQVDAAAPEPPERDEELLRELDTLSPEHRAVIVLRYVLDYTPGEIAELLELPRGTVNSRLRRGLDNLKERLQ